jgi:K+-transporting ATPase KdpF subunit
VSIFDWIALGSALLLGVYLTVALLKPEYFE